MARSKQSLTPTEASLIDLQRQRKAHDERRRLLHSDPPERDAREFPWPPEYLDGLPRCVRLEITFDNPVETSKQMRVVIEAATEAVSIAEDGTLSQQRKRLYLRNIVREAARTLMVMQGKTPRA